MLDFTQWLESLERANAMANAWRAGKSNLDPGDTEGFQKQYDMAREDDPRALVPPGGRSALEKRLLQQRMAVREQPLTQELLARFIYAHARNDTVGPEIGKLYQKAESGDTVLKTAKLAAGIIREVAQVSIPRFDMQARDKVIRFLANGTAKILTNDPNRLIGMPTSEMKSILKSVVRRHLMAQV
jgi:hypothetical protein